MELKAWLTEEPGRATALSAFLMAEDPEGRGKAAGSFISQWKSGTRPVPPRFGHLIERFTEKAVMRWDVCPDWYWLWPELKDHRDAPAIRTKPVKKKRPTKA